MMSSDESQRGESHSNDIDETEHLQQLQQQVSDAHRRASIDSREEIVVADLDPENVIYPPDHEIESTPLPRRRPSTCSVYSCTACAIILILATVTLFSSINQPHDAGFGLQVIDDAPGAGTSAGHGTTTGGYVDVGQKVTTTTVIYPPTPAPSMKPPEKTTPTPTQAPKDEELKETTSTTKPPHSHKTVKPTTTAPTVALTTKSPTTATTTTTTTPAATDPSTTTSPSTTHQPTEPMHIKQGCMSDYFDNENMRSNNRLYMGQYICSPVENDGDDPRFRFGVDIHGNVVWRDMKQNRLKLLYKNPFQKTNQHKSSILQLKDTFYLLLQRNGHLVLHWVDYQETGTPDTVVWTAVPDDTISLTERCKPKHDCPYLHLRKSGVVAVDWLSRVDEDGDGKYDWEEKNFMKHYDY